MQLLDYTRPLISPPLGEIAQPELLGGMFPRGYVHIIASKPGIGKTWLMLLKAQALVDDGFKVLIFNGETSLSLLQMRAAALSLNLPPELLRVCTLPDFEECGGIMLTDAKGWSNIVSLCEDFAPDVVFFDSLIAFVNADESDMLTMRDVFMRLTRLVQKYMCAVVLNHHLRKSSSGKPAEISIDELIGSSILGRIACNVFSLTRKGDLVTISCIKTWFTPLPEYSLQFKNDDDGHLRILSSRPAELLSNKKKVMRLLEKSGDMMDSKQIAFFTKLPLRTVQHVLSQLLAENAIERKPSGDKGRSYLYAQKRK